MSVTTTTGYVFSEPLPGKNPLDPVAILYVFGELAGDASAGYNQISLSLPGDFVYVLEHMGSMLAADATARVFQLGLTFGIRPDGTTQLQYAQTKTGVVQGGLSQQWVLLEPTPELPIMANKGENVTIASTTTNTNGSTHRLHATFLQYPRSVFRDVSFSEFHLMST